MNMAFSAPSEGSDLMDKLSEELGTIKKPRIIVPIVHLYLEYFLQRLIEESFVNHEQLVGKEGKGASYLTKVKLLYAMKELDDNQFNDLVLINTLRNEFIHNLDPNEDKIKEKCDELILIRSYPKTNLSNAGKILQNSIMLFEQLNDKLEEIINKKPA